MSNRGGGTMNFRGYRGRGGRGGPGGGASNGVPPQGGGGGSRGRGSFRGRGGGYQQGHGGGGGGGGAASDEPCKTFLTTGECRFGDNCHYAHNLRLHKEFLPQTRDAHVRAVALYAAQGMVVYSEGAKVKFLSDSLALLTEISLDGPVTALLIVGHFMFVGYEAAIPGVTAMPVGLMKSFFLATTPPTEFALTAAPGTPWAHRNEIIALDAAVLSEDPSTPPVLFSASLDCTIRMWQWAPAATAWESRVLEGHVRGITSLLWVNSVRRLYTGSVDRTIKVWDPATAACTHTILPPPASAAAPGPAGFRAAVIKATAAVSVAPGAQAAASGGPDTNGHSSEILGLADLTMSNMTFLVSGALDGSIKIWSLATPDRPTLIPDAVIAPDVNRRLLSLAVIDLEAAPGNPILIVGQQDGSLVLRDVQRNLEVAATLHASRNGGHSADVRVVLPGPSDYFFSGGNDGKLCVWQAICLPPPTAAEGGVK